MTAKVFASGKHNWPRRLNCSSWSVLILISLISVLSGCAIGTRPTQVPAPTPPPPGLEANLRQPCPPLPQATSAKALQVLAQHDAEATLYHDCRSKTARLIQASEEWQATAWQWYCKAAKQIGIDADGCPRK